MSAESAGPPAGTAPSSLALRERLLASFLEDSAILLAEHNDSLASMYLPSGARVVLITCSDDTRALRSTVDGVVGESKAGTVHLVAVGCGSGAASELRSSAPFWQINRRFGFHCVHPGGEMERVSGPALRELQRAVAKQPTATPLSEEQISSLLARSGQRLEENARALSSLRGGFPWVTTAIGALCVVLFALGKVWSEGDFSTALYRMGANSRAQVEAGEPWRVLASAFLHANVEHLFVNMIALVSFGLVLEMLLGARRYILLYGLSALGGGLASAFLGGNLSVGASGAIWGLMAAGFALSLRPRGLLPPLLLAQARRRAAVPLAINVLYSFMPGIDLFAHFGGGLVGFGLMLSGAITRGMNPIGPDAAGAAPRRERAGAGLTAGAAVFSIALLGSVLAALATGKPWTLGEPPVLTRVVVADTGVSLELPSLIAERPVDESKGFFRTLGFGAQLQEGMAVEVSVRSRFTSLAPDELDRQLEVARSLAGNVPPGAEQIDAAKVVKVRGHSFLALSYRMNAVTVRIWMSIFGHRQVILRIYRRAGLPSSWAGIEDAIVASLQVQ
jgi:rhomboid protease GluP